MTDEKNGTARLPAFEPGLHLAAAFYESIVRPLLNDIPHSAARLGEGSDVLGFDTDRSTDHGWGPRLQLYVRESDIRKLRAAVDAGLPEQFRGWPVRFGWDEVPVSHHVEVETPERWLTAHLGFDPMTTVGLLDWLATPQQLLLQVTAGAVFHDGLGVLIRAREALAWYPDEVWRWLLGCQWARVGQEEAFVGRTAEVGDELGSRVVAARLARDVMRLSFLIERRYAPYSKWLGSAFGQLQSAGDVGLALARAMDAPDASDRQQGLLDAYTAVAVRQNKLGITAPQDPTPRGFHGRPYQVLGAERFAEACFARIQDPKLRSLPPIGAIDQWGDSADLLTPDGVQAARAVLSAWW